MGCRKDAADSQLLEQLPSCINAVPLASETNIHHRQSGLLCLGKGNRFFRGGRTADHVESCLDESSYGLQPDQEIILHH